MPIPGKLYKVLSNSEEKISFFTHSLEEEGKWDYESSKEIIKEFEENSGCIVMFLAETPKTKTITYGGGEMKTEYKVLFVNRICYTGYAEDEYLEEIKM